MSSPPASLSPNIPQLDIDNNSCFFYGTLMAPAVLSRVIYGTTKPEAHLTAGLKIMPASLPDYARHCVKGVDYPAIVPEKAKEVKGVIVSGIRQTEMWRLDIFEGDEYERCYVDKIRAVTDINGDRKAEDKSAYVYVWNCPRPMLEEREWEYEDFVKTKIHNWTGEPQSVDLPPRATELAEDPLCGRSSILQGFQGTSGF